MRKNALPYKRATAAVRGGRPQRRKRIAHASSSTMSAQCQRGASAAPAKRPQRRLSGCARGLNSRSTAAAAVCLDKKLKRAQKKRRNEREGEEKRFDTHES